MLTRIIDVFPRIKKLFDHIERRVDALRKEDRQDLQILAMQYYAQLQKIKPTLLTQEQASLITSLITQVS